MENLTTMKVTTGLLFGRLELLYDCAEWANWKELDGNSEPVGGQES